MHETNKKRRAKIFFSLIYFFFSSKTKWKNIVKFICVINIIPESKIKVVQHYYDTRCEKYLNGIIYDENNKDSREIRKDEEQFEEISEDEDDIQSIVSIVENIEESKEKELSHNQSKKIAKEKINGFQNNNDKNRAKNKPIRQSLSELDIDSAKFDDVVNNLNDDKEDFKNSNNKKNEKTTNIILKDVTLRWTGGGQLLKQVVAKTNKDGFHLECTYEQMGHKEYSTVIYLLLF